MKRILSVFLLTFMFIGVASAGIVQSSPSPTVSWGYTDTVMERENVTEYSTVDNSTVIDGWHFEQGEKTYLYDVGGVWTDVTSKNSDGEIKDVEITVELEPNNLTRLLAADKEPWKSISDRQEYFNDNYYYNGGDISSSEFSDLESELSNIPVAEGDGTDYVVEKTTSLSDKPKNVTVKVKMRGSDRTGNVKIGSHSTVVAVSGGSNDNYDSSKTVNVTSASGTPTVSKAQPVNLTCGDDTTTGTGQIVVDCSAVDGVEDIDFSNTTDHRLPYEIEEFNLDTGGDAVVWVYNDWVRDGTPQLKVHYGSGSTDEQNVAGTWSNTGQNAEAVWHLDEASGQTIDSTSNNRDSTSTTGTTYDVSGEFDGARDFDGATEFIDTGYTYGSNDGTFIAWINPDSTNDGNFRIPLAAQSGGAQQIQIRIDPSGQAELNFNGNEIEDTGNVVSQNAWHQLVGVDRSSSQELYLDGDSKGTASNTIDLSVTTVPFYIGARNSGSGDANHFDGTIDAVRIYSDGKSSDWVQADYDASPQAGQTFFSQQSAAEPDTTPPKWRNLQDNASAIVKQGDSVNISAEWIDNESGLNEVFVEINESGSWNNVTKINPSVTEEGNSYNAPQDAQSITWKNDNWYVVRNDGNINRYYRNWTSIESFDLNSLADTTDYDGSATSIDWNGTHWFVATDKTGVKNGRVFVLYDNFSYTGIEYDISSQTDFPDQIETNGTNWVITSNSFNTVYQYDLDFNLQTSYSLNPGGGLDWNGSNWIASGTGSNSVDIYSNDWSTLSTTYNLTHSDNMIISDTEFNGTRNIVADINSDRFYEYYENWTYTDSETFNVSGKWFTVDYIWKNNTFTGNLGYRMYGSDANGNYNVTDTGSFQVLNFPQITIHSPENRTYQEGNSIDLDVSSDDPMDTWIYNLDGQGNNTFVPNTTTFTGLSPEHHTVEVWANNTDGNWDYETRQFTVVTPPDPQSDDPANNEVFPVSVGNSTDIQFNWTVNAGNLSGDTSLVVEGVTENTQSYNPDTTQTFTFTKSFSAGTYDWYVTANDGETGQKKSVTRSFTVSESEIANISLDSPAPGTTFEVQSETANKSVTLQWTVSGGDESGTTTVYVNGNNKSSQSYNSGQTATFSHTLSLGTGTYSWKADAEDTLGQTNTTNERTFRISTAPFYEINLTAPSDESTFNFSTERNVTFNYTVEGNRNGQVRLYLDPPRSSEKRIASNTFSTTAGTVSTVDFSTTYEVSERGQYTWYVNVTGTETTAETEMRSFRFPFEREFEGLLGIFLTGAADEIQAAFGSTRDRAVTGVGLLLAIILTNVSGFAFGRALEQGEGEGFTWIYTFSFVASLLISTMLNLIPVYVFVTLTVITLAGVTLTQRRIT